MALCESSTPEANYHLCCQRVEGQPECPNLGGQHSSQSYSGTEINSLGVPCTGWKLIEVFYQNFKCLNKLFSAPIGEGICPPGKVYLPGPRCCILRGFSEIFIFFYF